MSQLYCLEFEDKRSSPVKNVKNVFAEIDSFEMPEAQT
jgi:hypothetical protein